MAGLFTPKVSSPLLSAVFAAAGLAAGGCSAAETPPASRRRTADAPALTPAWTTTENLAAPESVYFDPTSNQTFVSNIAGNGAEKDGIGWIATLTVDAYGAAKVTKIVEGLNAPKGLRVVGGVLYAADIDELVEIDAASHKLLAKVKIPGAVFLNDPAVAKDGTVYVSDTIGSKIFVVRDAKPELFAEGEDLESPYGLLLLGDKLFVASWGFITDPATFGAKTPGHLYYLHHLRPEHAAGRLFADAAVEPTSEGPAAATESVARPVRHLARANDAQ